MEDPGCKGEGESALQSPVHHTPMSAKLLNCDDPGCKDPGCKDPGFKDPGCKDPGCKDPGCKGEGESAL